MVIWKNSFYIFTLGCAKNEFDSLNISRKLEKAGFKPVRSAQKAEFVILNTCSFIESAVKETFDTAFKLRQKLKEGQKFIFAGCAVNYFRERIVEAVEADYYISTDLLFEIDRILNTGLPGLHLSSDDGKTSYGFYETAQEKRPFAYLKLAEGCSNFCSYCLIPVIRGSLKSIPKEKVISEALRLVAHGVKELNLIAQDLASYGIDLYGQPLLSKLLKEMTSLLSGEKVWIRLLYLNPDRVNEEEIREIFKMENVVPYLEMPVQSGSEKILKLMNRKKSPEDILKTVNSLRKEFQNLTLRTTFLTGFPAETEDDFLKTVDFLQELRPDYVSVFAYSDMEKTKSFSFKLKVPQEVAVERANRLSEIAYKIMEEKAHEKEGEITEILVEKILKDKSIGRAYFQAPEIDGQVVVAKKLKPKNFYNVKLEYSTGIDFKGEIED